jgi:hypothetical protein
MASLSAVSGRRFHARSHDTLLQLLAQVAAISPRDDLRGLTRSSVMLHSMTQLLNTLFFQYLDYLDFAVAEIIRENVD